MSGSLGMKLVSSLINDGELKTFSKLDVNPATLKESELEAYQWVQNFVYAHKAMPQMATFLSENDQALPIAKEVPSYYANQVVERFIATTIKSGYKATEPFLTKETMNIKAGVEELTKCLMTIHNATNKRSIVDFKNSKKFLEKAYKEKKIQGMDGTVLTGYPTVDLMSGGMVGGDLISIVGRPAMGKTWSTLYQGHRAWYYQKKVVLYIPMEMPLLSIEQRLASMHTKHNLTQIKKAQLSTKAYKDLLNKLLVLEDHDSSLWIADGNLAATVPDIWKLCMQVQPDLVIVDGAYLLSHENLRIGKYERVGENTRLLKQMLAMDFNIPVVASWQFNRNATTKLAKNKDAEAELEDIGYSDEIGQISSLVLGLTQRDSVETIIRRKCKIMKGRDGETGEFLMNWDFFNMDFSEVPKDWKSKAADQHDALVID